MQQNKPKIAVVRLDRIGDTILTLPAIKIIRDHYRDYQVVGIFNPHNSRLFVYDSKIIHPYFDSIQIIPVNLFYRNLKGHNFLNDVLNYLKILFFRDSTGFEKVFVFSPTTVSYLLGSKLKASKKYTYFYQTRINRFFFSHNYTYYIDEVDKSQIDDLSKVRHEVFQNIEVVKLDLDISYQNSALFKEDLEFLVQNFTGLTNLVVPNVSFEKYDVLIFDKEMFFYNEEGKVWLTRFVSYLIQKIQELSKKSYTSLKVAFISPRKIHNAIHPEFMEMMNMIKDCRCLICFDSGIMHIASAFNVNLIAIFANRYFDFDVKRWKPLSKNVDIIKLDIFNELGMFEYQYTDPVEFANYVFSHTEKYLK
ncbi:MAG: glycosyltransferase family 9 protein [bacterium]